MAKDTNISPKRICKWKIRTPAIKEMQIKTIMCYHYTTIITAKI